jgi:hypothetical protein
MGHLCGVIGNIQIAIFITVVNPAIATMHLRAFWHVDTLQGFPIKLDNILREIRWRRELQRVVDCSNKLFFDLRYSIRLNALKSSVILNTKQNRTTMAIEKGANRLINIAIDLIPASFEFYRNPLTLTNQFIYLLYADVHTLPFKIQNERDLIP